MGIISITTDVAGQINVNPRRVKIITTDNLATVETAGYLNPVNLQGYTILPTDVIDMIYLYNTSTQVGTYDVFLPTISNGVITLSLDVSSGNVMLPVVSGNFAVFNGTSGLIADNGYFPSNPAKTTVMMANGATIANQILLAADTSGTAKTGGAATNAGDIQAGLSGTAGKLKSFPAAAASGSLQLVGVASSGDYSAVISNASLGQATTWSIPDPSSSTANFIISKSSGTQTISSGNLSVSAGNITAGASGAAGTIGSFPSAATSGELIVAAVTNSAGNFNTTISNASSVGQNQVISIPDSGSATASFIMTNATAGQTMGQALTVNNAFQANSVASVNGNLVSGVSTGGFIGAVQLYPTTASKGSLTWHAVANSGNTATVFQTASLAQATTYTVPDPAGASANMMVAPSALVSGNMISASGTAGLAVDSGIVANRVLYTSFSTPDTNANTIRFDITVGEAALAAGGSVTLITSSGSKQYKISSLQLNSGGTNFSGGGGDRLGQVTDGTTVYSVIPAANLQTLSNAQWGATALPNPASAAINTSTVAGANLVFKYSGGTTDYTAGSLVISGIAQRVA